MEEVGAPCCGTRDHPFEARPEERSCADDGPEHGLTPYGRRCLAPPHFSRPGTKIVRNRSSEVASSSPERLEGGALLGGSHEAQARLILGIGSYPLEDPGVPQGLLPPSHFIAAEPRCTITTLSGTITEPLVAVVPTPPIGELSVAPSTVFVHRPGTGVYGGSSLSPSCSFLIDCSTCRD